MALRSDDTWLDEGQVYIRLEQAVMMAGTAAKLAERWGISEQFLGDVRRRRRNLTITILDRLGIERITKYRVNPYCKPA